MRAPDRSALRCSMYPLHAHVYPSFRCPHGLYYSCCCYGTSCQRLSNGTSSYLFALAARLLLSMARVETTFQSTQKPHSHDLSKSRRGLHDYPTRAPGTIDSDIEFPQSQARASEVIPTQVLQGTRKKRVR
ncbi:hypothetical protein M405DRAFT_598499 [Rhizopogon salebrosus TDB-379]|nr:hypothetical protein M405DRAFT_598499 [Rhizopogon salebrosus TDB-379]